MEGECLARHGSIPGMCWGKFSSQNTKSVDQYDPTTSQALTTQWALASTPFNTLNLTGNITNNMSYAGSSSVPTQTSDPKAMKAAANEAKKQAAKEKKALAAAQKEAQKAIKKAQKATKAGAACSKSGGCDGCA
jgi:hypothetical protein